MNADETHPSSRNDSGNSEVRAGLSVNSDEEQSTYLIHLGQGVLRSRRTRVIEKLVRVLDEVGVLPQDLRKSHSGKEYVDSDLKIREHLGGVSLTLNSD